MILVISYMLVVAGSIDSQSPIMTDYRDHLPVLKMFLFVNYLPYGHATNKSNTPGP